MNLLIQREWLDWLAKYVGSHSPSGPVLRLVEIEFDWDWPAVPECAKPVCPTCLSPI